MSLVIRMARAGTKKRPVYHIVVADTRSPRDGRFIERLGYFNPLLPKDKTERLKLDLDKVQAWMKKGAQPSDRVMRFLDAAGIAQAREAQQSGKGDPAQGTQGRGGRSHQDQGSRRRRRQDRGEGQGSDGQGRGGQGEADKKAARSAGGKLSARRRWPSASSSPGSAPRMACAAK